MSFAVSERKLEANRLNAQKSTGPRTPEGKARSSQNAITHAVYCKNMVIHGEDPEYAHNFKQQMLYALNPNNILEQQLVEQIIHDEWRIKRARAWEEDVFTRLYDVQRLVPGQREVSFTSYQVKQREDARNQADRWQKYEMRLRNSTYRAMKELREMQKGKHHEHPDMARFACRMYNDQEDAHEQQPAAAEAEANDPAKGGVKAPNEATAKASEAQQGGCAADDAALSASNRDIAASAEPPNRSAIPNPPDSDARAA